MHQLYDILGRWDRATEEEVKYVKHTLMPEDSAERITMKLTEHPNIRGKEIFIEWFDIDVYDEHHQAIGHIIIHTSDGTIEYNFEI